MEDQLTPAKSSITDSIRGTIRVALTWHFLGTATSHLVSGITLITVNTSANSTVIGSTAFSIETTLGFFTHISTFWNVIFFSTESRWRAVFIYQTVHWWLASFCVSISHSTRGTETLVAATEVVTPGTRTTWLLIAKINGLASFQRIPLESFTAEAHSLVSLRDTKGIFPTLVVYTTCTCKQMLFY